MTASFSLSPDGPASGRAVALALLRPLLGGALLIAAYFVFPLGKTESGTKFWLSVGIIGLAAMCAWEIRRFRSSAHPVATAVEMLVGVGTFYVVVFSTTYFLMSEYGHQTFNERLTRLDALYFSLTVFTTTGFGDVAPDSQTARAVVSVQMISTFVLLGLGLRLLQVLVRRRTGGD
ncbi:potassium channel family protein [Gordonia sp. CPCC 205333]|uniref:potassium channel family protein n=1 Tax=Gordonia sp. CPCC 205333 TaxID=3140790 RepID=UPI003AF394E1